MMMRRLVWILSFGLALAAACSNADGGQDPTTADAGAAGVDDVAAPAGAGGAAPTVTANGGSSLSGEGPTASGGGGGDDGSPVAGCDHSRECDVTAWCNPATRACELRNAPPKLGFDDVYDALLSDGCPTCHVADGSGEVDKFGSGTKLRFDDADVAYRNLVAAGLSCTTGKRRVCVDDPASAALATQTLKTPGTVGKPYIAFQSWNEPKLQLLLRWMAQGAPLRDQSTRCGNFEVEGDEECDEGPTPPAHCAYGKASCTICSADCHSISAVGAFCGDGAIDAPRETCDDGNTDVEECDGPSCAVCGSECRYTAGVAGPSCGNGEVEVGEECDTAGATSTCDADCTLVHCGDGLRNAAAGEECDLGAGSDALDCSATCRTPRKVRSDANPGGDGLTWATAFATINGAITAAVNAGAPSVWVAKGTYLATSTTPLVTMPQGQALLGGFLGNEQFQAERQIAASPTILDGAHTAYHVVLGAPGALLDGFVIQNGNAVGAGEASQGGGVFVDDPVSFGKSMQIKRCTFLDNYAQTDGGGVASALYSSYVLTDSVFNDNAALGRGGGAYLAFEVRGSSFAGNEAKTGGGIALGNSVEGCTFDHNKAMRGGALADTTDIKTSTFLRNEADNGGAISQSSLDARDCTFIDNRATFGGAIECTATPIYGTQIVSMPYQTVTGSRFRGNQAQTGALVSGFGVFMCDGCTIQRATEPSDSLISLSGQFTLRQSSIDDNGASKLFDLRGIFDNSRYYSPDVTVVGSAIWAAATTVAGNSAWRTDSCVAVLNGVVPAGSGTTTLNEYPFVPQDKDGDGAFELYLKPGTPCAGIYASGNADLANRTTSTTGCRDTAPFDAGAHYVTTSSAACAP